MEHELSQTQAGPSESPKTYEMLWTNDAKKRKAQQTRQDYYEGKHAILKREDATYVDGSLKSKRVSNWIRYGVDSYVGSITAQSFVITSKEDTDSVSTDIYADISDDNNLDGVDVINTRNAFTKGYGIECHEFIDGEIVIKACDPLDWTLSFDSAGDLINAVYMTVLQAGTYHRGELLQKDVDLMIAYTDKTISTYERGQSSTTQAGDNAGWDLISNVDHQYKRVPLVVWGVNASRTSRITDDLIGQSDEYNDIDNISGDDIRYDSDGVLVIKGYSVENVMENAEKINKSKTLALSVDGGAEFLQKHTDFSRIESRLQRTREHIFAALAVPDVESILGSTGTTSGIALKLKFKPMVENANAMIIHLKQGMRARIDMINAVISMTQNTMIEGYNVIINFNLPVNRIEEWANIGSITGIVSHMKQLEMMSDVSDPQVELDRLEKEAEDAGFIEKNSGTPEDIVGRIDAVMEQALPMMRAAADKMVDVVADAALASVINSNKVKATSAVAQDTEA